jgi:hypothetical protein
MSYKSRMPNKDSSLVGQLRITVKMHSSNVASDLPLCAFLHLA